MIVDALDGSIPPGATIVLIPSMTQRCDPEVVVNFEASLQALTELGCTLAEAEPLAGFDPEAMALAKQVSQMEKAAYIEDILRERPHEVS